MATPCSQEPLAKENNMDQLEKLKQEEAELEAQMLGNQTEPEDTQEPEVSTTEDTGIERTEEELAADEYMMETITDSGDQEDPEQPEPYYEEPEPEPQPQAKQKRTNWKKRFTNYKASTDATINGLRKDLIDFKDQNAALAREIHRLQVSVAEREVQGDVFEGAFSQEDEDTFGADGLDVVKKAAKVAIDRKIKPLEKELQQQKEARVQDLTRSAQRERNTEYNEFLSRLEALVPEYAELNRDQGFLQFIAQPDAISGYKRVDLLRQAERSRDVARVADFFMEYQASRAPKPPEIPQDVRKRITPVGTGGAGGTQRKAAAARQKGLYRRSDIDKFYSDVMKGRYAGKQDVIAATEKAIEEAAVDGRILHNE